MSFISASLNDDCCVWPPVKVDEDEQVMRRVLDEPSLLKVVLRRWYLGEGEEREIGDDGHGHNRHGNDISTV